MSQQFWVNNYLIDIKRNQISHQQQLTPIAPKALAVLAILAEHAGEVVSHDVLMDRVWPDTIVTPNTLQRCIAQLRKAFGDDSKHQAFIKTHSKQGYSLEAAVCWDNPQPSLEKDSNPIPSRSSVNNIWLAMPMLLLVIAVGWWQMSKATHKIFNNVKPLTASDAKETNARYSPDGKYLVFHRFQATCEHHIWAKDLSSQQEFRLTKEPGIYGSHSWSQDGTQLTFSALGNCAAKAPEAKACWSINTLDFSSALQSPQSIVQRLNCREQRNAVARYLPHGKIGMLREIAPYQNEIVAFDPRDKQLHVIYGPSQHYIYSYDYSFESDRFAVISRGDDNQHYIEMLTRSGEVLSSYRIKRRPQDSSYEFYNVYFHPDGKSLVTNTSLGIFDLSFKGRLTPINTLSQPYLFDANYHPDGKRLVASQLNLDKDILHLPSLSSTNEALVIARSNNIDEQGKFQPYGNAIAFMSLRTGKLQLWLIDGSKLTQLSNIPDGFVSDSFIWSPSGDAIAAIDNDQLIIFDLAGNSTSYTTSGPIEALMQWTTSNELIIGAKENNQSHLFSFTIARETHKGELKAFKVPPSIWGQQRLNQQLVYLDEAKRVWLGQHDSRHLSLLDGQVFKHPLVIYNDQLWGINKSRQLWRFDMVTDEFVIEKQLDENTINLSDVSHQGFLINYVISNKKELVEFSYQE